MARKILEVTIKTSDEKGHIGIFHKKDIDLSSLKFKVDAKSKKEDPKKKN